MISYSVLNRQLVIPTQQWNGMETWLSLVESWPMALWPVMSGCTAQCRMIGSSLAYPIPPELRNWPIMQRLWWIITFMFSEVGQAVNAVQKSCSYLVFKCNHLFSI